MFGRRGRGRGGGRSFEGLFYFELSCWIYREGEFAVGLGGMEWDIWGYSPVRVHTTCRIRWVFGGKVSGLVQYFLHGLILMGIKQPSPPVFEGYVLYRFVGCKFFFMAQ